MLLGTSPAPFILSRHKFMAGASEIYSWNPAFGSKGGRDAAPSGSVIIILFCYEGRVIKIIVPTGVEGVVWRSKLRGCRGRYVGRRGYCCHIHQL